MADDNSLNASFVELAHSVARVYAAKQGLTGKQSGGATPKDIAAPQQPPAGNGGSMPSPAGPPSSSTYETNQGPGLNGMQPQQYGQMQGQPVQMGAMQNQPPQPQTAPQQQPQAAPMQQQQAALMGNTPQAPSSSAPPQQGPQPVQGVPGVTKQYMPPQGNQAGYTAYTNIDPATGRPRPESQVPAGQAAPSQPGPSAGLSPIQQMQDQVQKLSQPVTQQAVLEHVKSMGLDPNNPAVRANMPSLMADLQASNEKRAATLAKVAGDMQRIDQMQSSIKIAQQRAEEYRRKALLAPSERNREKAKAAMELVKLAQKQVQEIGNKGAAGWFTGESPEHKAAADNLKDAESKLKSSEEAVFGTPEVGADNAGFQEQLDELLATLRDKE